MAVILHKPVHSLLRRSFYCFHSNSAPHTPINEIDTVQAGSQYNEAHKLVALEEPDFLEMIRQVLRHRF